LGHYCPEQSKIALSTIGQYRTSIALVENLNLLVVCLVKNYERSKSDEVTAMTIQAETLVQLTEALQLRGMNLVSDVHFTRAPYRQNHLWVCSVE
jgi:hypothetical protein